MVKKFKICAIFEGLFLLILLFIAMPLKYISSFSQMVQLVGMAHKLLFLLYIVLALILYYELKWSFKILGIIMFASVIPFGAIYVDKKHLTQ
ncbi:MAG: DUF3817 domain-containing protein [Lutibacter sp.]|jgi:integral membrane protein